MPEMKDWADNESVTTDEDDVNPPQKKNIHARRWTLITNADGTLTIEGGRVPKVIRMPDISEMVDKESYEKADFVLKRLGLSRFYGRNGHVSPGISYGTYIFRTLETMKDDFKHYQNQWLQSEAHTSLRSTITSLKRFSGSHVPINNIVCLALGSPQNSSEACRGASLTQLAVLMTVMEDLDLDITSMFGKFVMQDPAFTPLDAEFLTSLGFIVADDPEGFLAITDNTLVFSIAGYLDMDWVISQGPWPAAFICGDIEEFMNGVVESARTQERVSCPTKREQEDILQMLSGCDMSTLVPSGDSLQAWDSISRQKFYWRKKV